MSGVRELLRWGKAEWGSVPPRPPTAPPTPRELAHSTALHPQPLDCRTGALAASREVAALPMLTDSRRLF